MAQTGVPTHRPDLNPWELGIDGTQPEPCSVADLLMNHGQYVEALRQSTPASPQASLATTL